MNLVDRIKRNKTPLLIVLLTILTGFLVVIAIAPKGPTTTTPPAEKEVITPAETVLSMESASLPTATAQIVNVIADSGTNKVTGVQLELSYDPSLISNLTLSPGDFIKEPVELLNKVDITNGRITYVVGVPIGGEGIMGRGTVARISYTEVGSKGSVVEIRFLPKTLVAIEGFSATALKESIDFAKPVGEPASPSAQ